MARHKVLAYKIAILPIICILQFWASAQLNMHLYNLTEHVLNLARMVGKEL